MQQFKDLVKAFEKRISEIETFPQQPANLYEPCHYLMGLGGKRVRPVLCLMGNELFGEIKEDAWHAALGIELFHNFTLVHDDIMDKAPLRRGKETIHAKYGLTAGILSGDILCIYAYEQFAKIKEHLAEVLALFNRTAIEVCEGQQWDMDYETTDNVAIDDYINMIALKTSVLLACSLKIGAIIGGADERNANKAYEFGKNLGIAFQLQDDYLDAFGETDKLGKQNGGDIKANKKTCLLLKAIELADEQHHVNIIELLAGTDEDKVQRMLDIYRETKADVACREEVKKYSDMAFSCLEEIEVSKEKKQPLLELATYLLHRDK